MRRHKACRNTMESVRLGCAALHRSLRRRSDFAIKEHCLTEDGQAVAPDFLARTESYRCGICSGASLSNSNAFNSIVSIITNPTISTLLIISSVLLSGRISSARDGDDGVANHFPTR